MGRNLIETIMGAVVLLVAGFFLVFAYSHANLKQVQGYSVRAEFVGVGGLDNGADVRINGIKVGTVTKLVLDPRTFNAVVTMSIRPDVHLPEDTVVSVSSDGLLGGKYVRLDPGHSHDTLAAGAELTHTKEYKSIEQIVGNLIFLATADGPAQKSAAPAPVSPSPAAPSQDAAPADGSAPAPDGAAPVPASAPAPATGGDGQ